MFSGQRQIHSPLVAAQVAYPILSSVTTFHCFMSSTLLLSLAILCYGRKQASSYNCYFYTPVKIEYPYAYKFTCERIMGKTEPHSQQQAESTFSQILLKSSYFSPIQCFYDLPNEINQFKKRKALFLHLVEPSVLLLIPLL